MSPARTFVAGALAAFTLTAGVSACSSPPDQAPPIVGACRPNGDACYGAEDDPAVVADLARARAVCVHGWIERKPGGLEVLGSGCDERPLSSGVGGG